MQFKNARRLIYNFYIQALKPARCKCLKIALRRSEKVIYILYVLSYKYEKGVSTLIAFKMCLC